MLGEYVKAVTAVLDSDRTAAVAERRRLLDFVRVKIKKRVKKAKGEGKCVFEDLKFSGKRFRILGGYYPLSDVYK